MKLLSPSNKILLLYYGILLVAMASWTNTMISPPESLRLIFFVALIIPLFKNKSWTPAILSLFLIVTNNSFATPVLPTGSSLYIVFLLFLLIHRGSSNSIHNNPSILLLLAYSFFINLYNAGTINISGFYRSLFLLYLFPFFIKKDDIAYPHFFSYVFIISSFVLSILFVLFGSQFVEQVGDYESYMWKDANYWSCVIGMGVIASFIELFFSNYLNRPIKLFLIITICLNLIVIVVNASRGAIMNVTVAFIVLILISNIRKRIKIISVLGFIFLIYVFFYSGVLDFLLYRISEEESLATGSGRTQIWLHKLNLFYAGNLLNRILGYGLEGGRALGADGNVGYIGLMSTHNDFLSFLIYYGYLGLLLFLYILFSPLKNKNNRKIVIVCSIFLVLSCLTLEPFAGGNIAWFAFLLYLYLWSCTPDISISTSLVK